MFFRLIEAVCSLSTYQHYHDMQRSILVHVHMTCKLGHVGKGYCKIVDHWRYDLWYDMVVSMSTWKIHTSCFFRSKILSCVRILNQLSMTPPSLCIRTREVRCVGIHNKIALGPFLGGPVGKPGTHNFFVWPNSIFCNLKCRGLFDHWRCWYFIWYSHLEYFLVNFRIGHSYLHSCMCFTGYIVNVL